MTEDELDGLSPLGRAAVWYCENGFAIFPLKPRSKEPATNHGLNDWFDDPESAKALWTRYPNYNIGIACGAPSHGLLVLDFDVGEDKNGIQTLRAWQASHGELPETSIALTGSGGRHYLYRTDRTNIRPSANVQLGVDVRCDGSYIVAPPSIHPNGDSYEWWESPEDTPIATADAQVYDFLDHVQRNGGVDESKPQSEHFELPDRIRKGERDNTLMRYGFSLRGKGYPDEMDPGREKLVKFGFPELMVKDIDRPYDSLRDATLKCWYSDDCFKALIVSGTDKAHGMPFDDGIGYTDAHGEPYDALECGEYTIRVTLSSRGRTLAQKEWGIRIGERAEQMIFRFKYQTDGHGAD